MNPVKYVWFGEAVPRSWPIATESLPISPGRNWIDEFVHFVLATTPGVFAMPRFWIEHERGTMPEEAGTIVHQGNLLVYQPENLLGNDTYSKPNYDRMWRGLLLANPGPEMWFPVNWIYDRNPEQFAVAWCVYLEVERELQLTK